MRGDLQRILLESIEYSAQVTLTCIWQEGYDLLALVLRTLRNLGEQGQEDRSPLARYR